MRTFLYSRQHPMGVIFSTDGSDPGCPRMPEGWKALGWTEDRADVQMTRDELIDAVVREELARQAKENSSRDALEAEYKDKTGDVPHFASKDKTLISVLDDSHARERKRPKK